jgi:hypothetical protein
VETIWEAKLLGKLADLVNEGYPDSEIAVRLTKITGKTISKNAVAGKRHRLGIDTKVSRQSSTRAYDINAGLKDGR